MLTFHDDTNQIQTWEVHPGGARLLELDPLAPTLDDVSRRLPAGVYTTFRTYNRRARVLGLTAHLDRLDRSAAHSGLSVPVDRNGLLARLALLLDSVAPAEARVRITVDTTREPGKVYISLQPLHPLPLEVYERGVQVSACNLHRDSPEVKSTRFIDVTRSLRAAMPPGVFELLMYDARGCILEGLTSNFFGILAGAVHTAGEGVLSGVTRGVALRLADQEAIPVVLQPVCLDDLGHLDEAFLTSSSRGIVPVVRIGERVVGDGGPGPLTRRLMQAYLRYLDQNAEPIPGRPA